jgi:hypothetical protein
VVLDEPKTSMWHHVQDLDFTPVLRNICLLTTTSVSFFRRDGMEKPLSKILDRMFSTYKAAWQTAIMGDVHQVLVSPRDDYSIEIEMTYQIQAEWVHDCTTMEYLVFGDLSQALVLLSKLGIESHEETAEILFTRQGKLFGSTLC